MGTEWLPALQQQRKVEVGGRGALKVLLLVLLAGLALRLLLGPSVYLLPPTASPEAAARVMSAREVTAGGRTLPIGERFPSHLPIYSSVVPTNKNGEWRAAVASQFSWRNVLGWDLPPPPPKKRKKKKSF
jgi:hypothetical protein